ncbi:MAG: diguanylate cyclase [Sulfuricurvum sp.]|uniref:GGDEF domain-containing response regulator n=1 Tax=Sulfuricurvum sp. TaxID=2025608 RepID=UPI002735041F|nr:diguanylate cyclase [Sulfuricurvum sp.]MDP2850317.1 diguanylate cyclase [Sulfuricurvum sp.]
MLKKFTLLYVEDNDATIDAFIGAFQEYFKTIFVARNGEEGLALFETSHPDIVLTDLQMPKMGGLEMIARMREISPNLPIIINSAFSDTHLLLKSITLHVDDYILKPTDPHLLLQAFEKVARVLNLEKSLVRSHTMMQTIIDEIPDPIMYIELDFSVSMMNKAAKELGGEDVNALLPKCYKISNNTSGACAEGSPLCPIEHVYKTKKPSTQRHVHTDKKGKKHHIDVAARPIFDADGIVIAYLEIRHDISNYLDIQNKLLHKTKKLTHISMHDSLTHLPNRRLLADRIDHAIERKTRSGGEFAIFFIDLDHFKEVNDTLGHLIGDQLLIQVAKRIRTMTRKGDTIARNGGDEFVLLIDDGVSKSHFTTVAEKILKLFEAPFLIQEKEIFSACSIGISIFPQDGQTVESLLHHADVAMYTSKEAGRQQFTFFLPQAAV